MRVAMYGGTFNPPHVGHMIVAEHVRTVLSLDRVLFVPAAVPPHKIDQDIISADHRLAMLQLAIVGNSKFAISDFEIRRGGVSFTIDTLRHLHGTLDGELFLLIGMDNLVEFHAWRAPDEILELATVVVMTRPGFLMSDVPSVLRQRVKICQVPAIEIASRDLRERVREGKSIRYLVADPVAEYIQRNALYRRGVSRGET